MKLAYFDCFSGISGDMTLGALVALGVPVTWLQQQLDQLHLDDFVLTSQGIQSHGIGATRIGIQFEESHHHRRFADIRELIEQSPFSEWVKSTSLDMFGRVAAAEAHVHQVSEEEVHFHEVGAMDAIIDIVGTCLGLEYLKIGAVSASPLPVGSGFVQCQHGTLPVPAPATAEILKGLPVYAGAVAQEMVTPTGAAIIATLADSFGPLPAIRMDRIGYGAGTRELEAQPNVLRIVLGESDRHDMEPAHETVVMVECNIDDMNPEVFGYLMDTLFEEGALDVFWEPIYMKKNRPGTLVRVLCDPDKRRTVVGRILSETTSLGVRYYDVQRACLQRQSVQVETPWGPLQAKKVVGMDGEARIVPEFEACRQVAKTHGVALRMVYDAVVRCAAKSTDESR